MGNINATRTSELIHISARTCPGRENLAIQRTPDLKIIQDNHQDVQHNIKQHHEDKITLRRDYNMP